MRVRLLNEYSELGFIKDNVYNVFSIDFWNNLLYIKWLANYIYPINMDNFEIIDNSLSKYWKIWKNEFWSFILWPEEIFIEKSFWERHYNDDKKCKEIINKYYNLAKGELFN